MMLTPSEALYPLCETPMTYWFPVGNESKKGKQHGASCFRDLKFQGLGFRVLGLGRYSFRFRGATAGIHSSVPYPES